MALTFRYTVLVALLVLPSIFAQADDASDRPSAQVNPIIGTAPTGHAYPGATVPFGMVQVSPDTRDAGWEGCSGYD